MDVFVSPGVEKVDLLVNGRPQPDGARTNTFLFTFPHVAWNAGTIRAVGYDAAGKEIAEMSHETVGAPAALKLSVIQGPTGLRADGSDVALVQTEVVDAQGRRCPLAQNVITYDVDGPAIWRGGFWEEDVARYANKKTLPVLNGIHRVALRSTAQPGDIRITARSPGLPPATVDIASRSVEIRDGVTTEPPAVEPVVFDGPPQYGPDLPPPPPVPPHAFDRAAPAGSASLVFDLSVAFPHGVEVRHGAADGQPVFKDRNWVFAGLPPSLHGADYLLVANDDASTSAGEGVVFKIGRPGRVYVAYDDRNAQFPIVSSPTPFHKTADKILIDGHPHTIYESAPMNGGELTYLGTNNWLDQPPPGANNYVVFVQADRPHAGR